MLPLKILDESQRFTEKEKHENWFQQLKNAGVEGVMVDVWWGIVETSAKQYKWTGYSELFDSLKNQGLKIIPVLSMHTCGENTGDLTVPLPSFVANSKEQPFFKDTEGKVDPEYISFAWDEVTIGGRTPIQMYTDYMQAFRNKFSSFLGTQIPEIEIGLGPAGELRYPSYRMHQGWSYPGCGVFQASDSKTQELIFQQAPKAEFRTIPRVNTRANPYEDSFWTWGTNNNYKSEYGLWFMKTYHEILVQHGERVTEAARKVFGTSMRLSGKVPGLHWWYLHDSHCIENTAGFYHLYGINDGYQTILNMFAKNRIHLCFTCLEKFPEYPYQSDPPKLVEQLVNDAKAAGIDFEGENALELFEDSGYNQVLTWKWKGLKTFTYLRLCERLMQDSNYNMFKRFVAQMSE